MIDWPRQNLYFYYMLSEVGVWEACGYIAIIWIPLCIMCHYCNAKFQQDRSRIENNEVEVEQNLDNRNQKLSEDYRLYLMQQEVSLKNERRNQFSAQDTMGDYYKSTG